MFGSQVGIIYWGDREGGGERGVRVPSWHASVVCWWGLTNMFESWMGKGVGSQVGMCAGGLNLGSEVGPR